MPACPMPPGSARTADRPIRSSAMTTHAEKLHREHRDSGNDPAISAAFNKLQSDFRKSVHVHSVTELFTTGLDVLLDILET